MQTWEELSIEAITSGVNPGGTNPCGVDAVFFDFDSPTLTTEAQDQRAIAIVRLIHTALKERDQMARAEGHPELTDQELTQMLQAMVGQRCESIRRYEESGASDLTHVRRFNEAIDEAMTESMDRFAIQTDLFRDQFIGVTPRQLFAHDVGYARRVWREFFDRGRLHVETEERRLDGVRGHRPGSPASRRVGRGRCCSE